LLLAANVVLEVEGSQADPQTNDEQGCDAHEPPEATIAVATAATTTAATTTTWLVGLDGRALAFPAPDLL
jgi:hypothetical protein